MWAKRLPPIGVGLGGCGGEGAGVSHLNAPIQRRGAETPPRRGHTFVVVPVIVPVPGLGVGDVGDLVRLYVCVALPLCDIDCEGVGLKVRVRL